MENKKTKVKKAKPFDDYRMDQSCALLGALIDDIGGDSQQSMVSSTWESDSHSYILTITKTVKPTNLTQIK